MIGANIFTMTLLWLRMKVDLLSQSGATLLFCPSAMQHKAQLK